LNLSLNKEQSDGDFTVSFYVFTKHWRVPQQRCKHCVDCLINVISTDELVMMVMLTASINLTQRNVATT